MKTHRLLVLLSLSFVMPGFVAAIAEETKEEPKPVPSPAAQPQLLAVMPVGVQRGTSAEVTVSGRSLAPIHAVTVDGRGVTAEIVPLPEGRRPSASAVKIRLTAAPDAEPGLHELRLRTPGGTSNVVRFEVGLLPQITEVEPNNEDGTSERLDTLPVIVNGALNRGEDRDCFRFAAKKGQTIVLDLCGQRLHPYIDRLRPGWLEGVLTVRDAAAISPSADENKAAQKLLAEKSAASTRAAAVVKSRRESAQQAATENAAAAKDASAKATAAKAATDLAAKTRAAADKAVAELEAARKKAAEVAAGEAGDTEKAAADQLAAGKSKQADAAQKAAVDAQAAADKANAAKSAADKLLAGKAAAAKTAGNRSTAAAANSKKANEELAAARTRAARAVAALQNLARSSVRNLACASHFAGRYDPALTFTAPHDGEFVVEVRDDLYRGRAEFTYRLTIGELPFVTHAFPAGSKRGTETTIQLDGVNLGDFTTLTAAVSSDAAPGRSRFDHVTTPLGPSNRFSLETSDTPEGNEAEPNDAADQATAAIKFPATLNGIIERDGDFDCYRFTATKGQRLVFETVSQSFGSPLDARLDLFDARGRRLKNNDDFNRLPDSRIDHTFAADGEYVIRVGDTTSLGSPSHVYRLHARAARPDFSLTVNPDNPRVTAGGSIALTVMIQRLDGFTGDVEVTVPNPPAGAVISPAVINSSQSQVTLTLTMPADAPAAVVPLEIEGKATIGETEISHSAVPVERMRYINQWRYVPVDDLSLSILPPAPFTLEWGQPDVTIVTGKNVELPLKLHRTPGFTDPVRIVLQGLPSRTYAPVVTFEKDATAATVEIRTAGNAPAGTGNAVANGTFRSFTQNSPALAVGIEVPEKK